MNSLTTFLFLNLLKLWVIIYELITFPIYFLFKDKSESDIMVAGLPIKEKDNAGPWRNIKSFDKLVTTPVPGYDTLVSLWERATILWPDSDAFGTREIISAEFEVINYDFQ